MRYLLGLILGGLMGWLMCEDYLTNPTFRKECRTSIEYPVGAR